MVPRFFFGRNEEEGLRCVYHGWKFDVHGNCGDMPSEPPESNFKSKVKVKAYPCTERGGVVWTYMGPRTTPPPLPDLEPNMVPLDGRFRVQVSMVEWNWVQAIENRMDTAHVASSTMVRFRLKSPPMRTGRARTATRSA